MLGGLIGMTSEEIGRLAEAEITGAKPQGRAYSV